MIASYMTDDWTNSFAAAAFGQYSIIQNLSDRTFLARDSSGSRVVIKMLDPDCLLGGILHPNIHDRLGRVREIAHTGIAHLYTVERDGAGVFAVWEYLDAQPISQYVQRLESVSALASLARDIILAVESLHALGIVHGRIHAANVFVDDMGRIRLTHISPLLYDNPDVDAHDVARMISKLAAQRGWGDTPLAQLAEQAALNPSLPALRSGLTPVSAAQNRSAAERPDHSPRHRTLFLALSVTLASVVTALILAHLAMQAPADKPLPPEAPSAALNSTP